MNAKQKRPRRVVGWTVGPGKGEPAYSIDAADTKRLKFDAGTYYSGHAGKFLYAMCIYATKPAALAAGRAFGWKEPVARRVVRR